VGVAALSEEEVHLCNVQGDSWRWRLLTQANSPQKNWPLISNGTDQSIRICIQASAGPEFCVGPGGPGRTVFNPGWPIRGLRALNEAGATIAAATAQELEGMGCISERADRPQAHCAVSDKGIIARPIPVGAK
jgi:hypothetical protein